MINGDSIIYWNGFSAKVKDLLSNGWSLRERFKFSKNNSGLNPIYYLSHRDHSLLARFSENNLGIPNYYELDFMINSKVVKKKALIVQEDSLGIEDIETMYLIISKLQKQYKKPEEKPMPVADIIKLFA